MFIGHCFCPVSLVSTNLLGGDGTKVLLALNHKMVVVNGMKGYSEHANWTESVEALKVITSLIGWAICIAEIKG